MSNTRVLKAKENSDEFNKKYELIQWTTTNLQATLEEIWPDMSLSRLRLGREEMDVVPGKISVYVGTIQPFENNRRFRAVILTDHGMLRLKSDWDLATVRLVYDNLDTILECAEKFCEKNGLLKDLHRKMARFEM